MPDYISKIKTVIERTERNILAAIQHLYNNDIVTREEFVFDYLKNHLGKEGIDFSPGLTVVHRRLKKMEDDKILFQQVIIFGESPNTEKKENRRRVSVYSFVEGNDNIYYFNGCKQKNQNVDARLCSLCLQNEDDVCEVYRAISGRKRNL